MTLTITHILALIAGALISTAIGYVTSKSSTPAPSPTSSVASSVLANLESSLVQIASSAVHNLIVSHAASVAPTPATPSK